jgi:hypothetical protein
MNRSQIFHSKNEEEVSFAPAVEQQEEKERDGIGQGMDRFLVGGEWRMAEFSAHSRRAAFNPTDSAT